MNLIDIFESSTTEIERLPAGYNAGADKGEDKTVLKLSDLRKTRMTLAHINKLRKLNDVRKQEFKGKLSAVTAQYAPPQQEQGGF